MSRLHGISTIVFVIALAIYGYMQWQQSQKIVTLPVNEKLSPAFVAKKLSTSQYNDQGQLVHTIYAENMTYFSKDNQTLFEQPQYTIFPKDNKPTWTLSAKTGALTKGHLLSLNDDVKLVSSEKNGLVSEIYGQSLLMDFNTNIISTEQTIIIKGEDFTMYGSGLEVDINTTKMTLINHEQTIYKKHES